MALLGIALTGAIAGGVTAGTAWYFLSPGLPSVEHMQDVPLQVPLRIYSRDARLIAQLGEYRLGLANLGARLLDTRIAAPGIE